MMREDLLCCGKRSSLQFNQTPFTGPFIMYVHSLNSKRSTVFLCVSKDVNTYFKCDHMFFATVSLIRLKGASTRQIRNWKHLFSMLCISSCASQTWPWWEWKCTAILYALAPTLTPLFGFDRFIFSTGKKGLNGVLVYWSRRQKLSE